MGRMRSVVSQQVRFISSVTCTYVPQSFNSWFLVVALTLPCCASIIAGAFIMVVADGRTFPWTTLVNAWTITWNERTKKNKAAMHYVRKQHCTVVSCIGVLNRVRVHLQSFLRWSSRRVLGRLDRSWSWSWKKCEENEGRSRVSFDGVLPVPGFQNRALQSNLDLVLPRQAPRQREEPRYDKRLNAVEVW